MIAHPVVFKGPVWVGVAFSTWRVDPGVEFLGGGRLGQGLFFSLCELKNKDWIARVPVVSLVGPGGRIRWNRGSTFTCNCHV